MGYTKEMYLGAYLHVKTALSLYEITDETKHEDVLSQALCDEERLILIPNTVESNAFIDTDEEEMDVDLDPFNQIDFKKHFSSEHKETIDFIESKVGKDNVRVMFGLVKYVM